MQTCVQDAESCWYFISPHVRGRLQVRLGQFISVQLIHGIVVSSWCHNQTILQHQQQTWKRVLHCHTGSAFKTPGVRGKHTFSHTLAIKMVPSLNPFFSWKDSNYRIYSGHRINQSSQREFFYKCEEECSQKQTYSNFMDKSVKQEIFPCTTLWETNKNKWKKYFSSTGWDVSCTSYGAWLHHTVKDACVECLGPYNCNKQWLFFKSLFPVCVHSCFSFPLIFTQEWCFHPCRLAPLQGQKSRESTFQWLLNTKNHT